MKVTNPEDGNNYFVGFKYQNNITVCSISIEGSNACWSGHAVKCRLDQFNKKIGRKISLTRALHQMSFSKNVRKSFWEQLMKKCRFYKNQILEESNVVKQS